MPYEFLEHVATADLAFKAWGNDLEATFVAAADAVMQVMIEHLHAMQPREERTLTVEHEARDLLRFNFLQELIYYKSSQYPTRPIASAAVSPQGWRHPVGEAQELSPTGAGVFPRLLVAGERSVRSTQACMPPPALEEPSVVVLPVTGSRGR